ncbi:UNVERIFIED_CONTAM: hypothetical protein Sradi_3026900 [Sesamum radiatum]|uniref:Uncharacterized protein n=1 Tax=Sesamum radiatum TaxID=300843 RepID=A0AAW2S3M2_SESRA
MYIDIICLVWLRTHLPFTSLPIPTRATGVLKAFAAAFALSFFLFQRLASLPFALEVEAPPTTTDGSDFLVIASLRQMGRKREEVTEGLRQCMCHYQAQLEDFKLFHEGKHLDPMLSHRGSLSHIGAKKYFCGSISNMPIWNRINLFHAEHYRRDIIVSIVLFLDIICHRCQYDVVDLPASCHLSNFTRSSGVEPSGNITGRGLSRT